MSPALVRVTIVSALPVATATSSGILPIAEPEPPREEPIEAIGRGWAAAAWRAYAGRRDVGPTDAELEAIEREAER